MSEHPALLWLLRAALGGGIVLLLAWWRARRIQSPARRQRLGEWALAAALLLALLCLAPNWIAVPLPASATPGNMPPVSVEQMPPEFAPLDLFEPLPEAALPPLPEQAPPAPDEEPAPLDWAAAGRLLVAAYLMAAGAMLLWWLAGHAALWRLLRDRRSPPPRLRSLWCAIAGCRRARLILSPRVRVPFSCGLLWPTVVLPSSLAETATDDELHWVLRHELRHLERGDALSAALFGLGQAVFFFLPWFWWLRREVRLCQEYLADQAAVEAGGDRVDYAGFLAGWADVPAPPVAAQAVAGYGSDLYRRVQMLLQKGTSLEARCPRRWLLAVACGLVALAVVLSGVGPAALAQDRREERKDDKQKPRDEKPKDDRKKDDNEKPKDPDKATPRDIDELLKKLPDLDEKQREALKRQLEAMQRQRDATRKMEEWLRANPNRAPRRPSSGSWLGLRLSVPSASLADQLDLPKGQGLLVDEVMPDSPAAKGGVKVNDVLLELNGKPVPNSNEGILAQVRAFEANKAVDLVVLRKGKKETIKGLKPNDAKADRKPERGLFDRGLAPRSMLNVQRVGDQFMFMSQEGAKMIQGRGKMADGKVASLSVQIMDGREMGTYDSLETVPAESRAAVKALIAACETKVMPKAQKDEKPEKPAERR